MVRAKIAGGVMVLAVAASCALAQSASPAKKPTCKEMQQALKAKCGGRNVNRPDPSNPGNLRGVWVWEEEKVGGKSSKEIDKASCDQIAGLYAKEFEGLEDSPMDENGWPILGKLDSSSNKNHQAPTAGPSLIAPGAKPDLKTGEYPNPIDPNKLTNEQKLDAANSAFGESLPGTPPLFSGKSYDAAMQATSGALATGKSYEAALQAGFEAGYKSSHSGKQPAVVKGNDPKSSGLLPTLNIGLGEYLGLDIGIGKTTDGFWTSTFGLNGGIGVGTPIGGTLHEGTLTPGWSWDPPECSNYFDGGFNTNSQNPGIGTPQAGCTTGPRWTLEPPFQSRESFDWINNGWAPPTMEPRWPVRSRAQSTDRVTAPSSGSGNSSWPRSARPATNGGEKK